MINRDTERYHAFTRRALLLGAGKLALFSVLAGRLVWLQVVEQEKFQTLSDKNRISLRLVPAGRGEIVDRFGVPLAINTRNFRAFIVPEQTQDIEKTLDRLSKHIPIPPEDRAAVLGEVGQHRPFTPLLVRENLTWDDMARVEVHIPDLPGVSVEEGEMRSYPLGAATAHIVGYVGRVSQAEIDAVNKPDPVMTIPGFRIGKSGVEKQYDEILRGQAGKVQAEVNVVGREIREINSLPAVKGTRLSLTLDADLQSQCQDFIAREKSASAILMDAHTGEVYALCSHPAFDPEIFSKGIPADLWEELLSSDAHPLTNKIVSGQYPPGSTFKMVTALAVMKAGISPQATVYCPGHYMLGRGKFHCWKGGGHGWMDAVQAISQSCDVYFYEMANRIGVDAIADMARELGLGSRLGFDIPGEGTGLVPDKDWKRRRRNAIWNPGETLNTSIGQGDVLATPLQLATMTARLVNGGKAVKPVLVRAIDRIPVRENVWPDLKLHPAHLRSVRRGMEAVVNERRGTGYGARIQEEGFEMGGKSGTAQVRRITDAMRAQGIKNEDLPWKFRHHALFVAYAPIHQPKYVTAVVVEHGVGGSKAAAPIARDILLAAQKRDPRKNRHQNGEE